MDFGAASGRDRGGAGFPGSALAGAVPAPGRKGAGAVTCARGAAVGERAGTGPHLGRYEAVKEACPGALQEPPGQAIITAEKCCPELFKAISSSYTDVRDIEKVIDDASEEFLKEYRDMLYEEKGLEENTLVATESVMKQLKQMDVDAPVVKGTEIESYLIAKANDKLGLIYEAKEEASKRSDEDDAWYYVSMTNWFILKCWFAKYGKRVSKEGKTKFENIMRSMEPSDFAYIKKYIPEDFEWTDENFENLEDEIKNQT